MSKKTKHKHKHTDKHKNKKKQRPNKDSFTKSSNLNWKFVAWACLALVGLTSLIIRLNYLGIPMERDEGIYAYFGQLILDGKVPYIDFHENKFPALYYTYALLVGITGQSLKGLQFVFIIINIGSAIFLYNAVSTFFNRYAGVIAAASFVILSLGRSISGFTTQSEHLVVFYFTLGLFLLAKALNGDSSTNFKSLFFAGVAICLGFMVKTTGVFLIVLGGLIVVLKYLLANEIDFQVLIKQTLIYSAGVFGIFGLFSLLMVIQGAFGEMLYWTVEHSRTYTSETSWEFGKQQFTSGWTRNTDGYFIFWIGALLGAVAVFFTRVDLYKKIMLVVAIPLAFMTIVPGKRFYGHYWIQLTPVLAMLVGVLFMSFKEILDSKSSKTIAFFVPTCLFLGIVLSNFATFSEYYFSPNHYKIMRQTYGGNPFPEAVKIADFLEKRSNSEDQLVLMGSEPQIYFYTDRKCPSEHAYFSYLMNDKNIPKVSKSIEEFKTSVEQAKPKHLVFFNHPISILARKNADMTIFDWMNNYIQQNQYKRIGVVDMVSISDIRYIFDSKATTYKPIGEKQAYIFER